MSSSGAKSRLTVVRGVITKFYHGVESRALECSLEKINEFKSTCEEYNSLVEERIDSLVSMDGTDEEIKKIESYVVKIKTVWDFFDSKVKMDNNACRNMPKIIIKFDGRKSNWLSFRDLFVTRYLANSQLSETEKFQLLRQAMPVYLHSFFNVNPTLKNIEWILSNLDDRYVSPDDSINEIFRDFKKIKPAFVNNDLRRLADELMVWFRRASDAEADSSRVEQEFLDNFFSLLPNGWAMPMKDYVSTLDLEGFELIEDILGTVCQNELKNFFGQFIFLCFPLLLCGLNYSSTNYNPYPLLFLLLCMICFSSLSTWTQNLSGNLRENSSLCSDCRLLISLVRKFFISLKFIVCRS